ncbi:ABC transporter ATP-binding protein [Saliphagus sp. LR7]|uniref:ABC transporter ATP-binding protein n=1 Tax=Saliphagus sp. LR7 TaxID=2282654 RepID=UPI000DF81867|nr:ABC transporter ATP-binding protein [Saliphagus sp. LR7]
MDAEDAVVVAKDLRKAYGDHLAVDGVSLSIRSGEVFALIGPNGAGKTTLIRALTGTTRPDSGSATILGTGPEAVDRDRIGVLPQSFSPPERLTARELLAYYAGLYDDAREPDTVLREVGLADAGNTRYENLSGGQQRRLCVGTALVNDPDVVIMDEPTTGIDPAGRRTVRGLVDSLAAGGTTVLVSTHDMAEAEGMADRVGLLADGDLVACDPPETLIAEYAGESRLVVETDSTLEGVDYPTRTVAGGVVVEGVDPTGIGGVVAALEERGIEYTGIAWSEPDLEDVYMELAGEVEGVRTGRSGEVGFDEADVGPAGAGTGGESAR